MDLSDDTGRQSSWTIWRKSIHLFGRGKPRWFSWLGGLSRALRIVDHAFDLKARTPEGKQKTEPETASLEIVDALGTVDGLQRGDRLEFDQNSLLDQQVSRVGTDNYTVIMDDNRMLLVNEQAGLVRFVRQSIFVDLFQKANAERVRHDKRAADDLVRKLVLEEPNRGRDAPCGAPPAQNRTGPTQASGSHLGS